MQDNTIYPVHPVWGTALAVFEGEPVWPQLGGAPDDDDDGPEIDLENPGSGAPAGGGQRDFLDDEPDDDDEPDEAPQDAKPGDKSKPVKETDKPERTAEDWQRLETAMQKERELRKKREGQIAEMRKERKAAETSGDTDEAERIRKAEEAAASRYKPVAVRAAAKAALLEANFQNPTEERVKKLIRRLDLDEIDVDEDGDITGLQDQIDQLVDDFPELFTAPVRASEPTKPTRPTKVTAANKPPVKQEPTRTADRIVAKIHASGQR
ncbi:hypothetical protein BBK82_03255 [Lentzea guizhouensis]|uniref:Scaffolding protein n=1 Tax=Lentzea guizhouensis TaxID=1586287 RepID=A0A1B2HBY3_9PSEU|nr:phage scaffolding protein [Lentzea guizhouensis]ANZ35235.1 hypothetical protein BBK82_03255 [Lentzea guizhouensis]